MYRFIRQAGFTMIELLVVIAVLGVLATAVLAAINPIEQINKGRDTGHRSDAEQLLSAVDRYYALHELFPWNDHAYNTLLAVDELATEALPGTNNCVTTVAPGGTGTFCLIPSAAAQTAPTACSALTKSVWLCGLIATAEIKPGFVDRLLAAKIGNELYLYKAALDANATLYVCFLPQSEGFKKEASDTCARSCAGSGSRPVGVCTGTCAGGVYTQDPLKKEMICLP